MWKLPDSVDRYSPFLIPTSVKIIQAYVQNFKCIAHCVRTQYHRRTDRQIFRAEEMSSSNLGSYINISRCYTCIDKPNIPTMRRL